MARALAYCHRRGIVHRDLKPENIVYASTLPDAPLKLVDFGFAKRVSAGGLGADIGSPWYVAPEILSSQPYGAAVDLWSLGCIAFIVLCGSPPFHQRNRRELFRAIRAGLRLAGWSGGVEARKRQNGAICVCGGGARAWRRSSDHEPIRADRVR